MLQMEQKCLWTKFVPSRTENVPNGTKNVCQQNLLQIKQKEQEMFANENHCLMYFLSYFAT